MLLAAVADGLANSADPGRAPRMQAYMKSEMPYLGVAGPKVRAVTKAAACKHPPTSVAHVGTTAVTLWRSATHREHRYAATELTCLPLADGSLDLLPLYEDDRHRGLVGPRRRGGASPRSAAGRPSS